MELYVQQLYTGTQINKWTQQWDLGVAPCMDCNLTSAMIAVEVYSVSPFFVAFAGIQSNLQVHTCQLPHIWGIFFLIFGLNSQFVTHSLIVTHFTDLSLIFEEMPLILMTFATHFHSYRLRGCEFGLPRINLRSRSPLLKNFGWQVCKHIPVSCCAYDRVDLVDINIPLSLLTSFFTRNQD